MDTMKMTREQLVAEAVDEMVAKWGEAERAGCEAMVAKKHINTLRAERQMRRGEEITAGRKSRDIAVGNLDEGHS